MNRSRESVRDDSAVIELRQYTLHPGRRDALVDLFDGRFVEPQERAGMRVLGQFRDLGDPDRFVWLRGFPDMATRRRALAEFYGGPVWKANREAANATMIDSDDVLLLRPVAPGASFALPRARQDAAGGEARVGDGVVVATTYFLRAPVDDELVRFFDARVRPILAETGGAPIAAYRTEYAENDFPALPVRSGVHAFVWFASFESVAALEQHRARLCDARTWSELVLPELGARLASPVHELRLGPTARSLVRHDAAPALPTGDVHDFDFLAGEWNVKNRRLQVRGEGSDDWDEFPGVVRAQLYLGGVANVDEIAFPTKGWSGMTVRLFDLAARRWSIHWVSSGKGALEPPVVGGFRGNLGEFYGDDHDGSRPVRVRFRWTRLGIDEARWEQAFSYDGAAWETNWVMAFARIRPHGPQ